MRKSIRLALLAGASIVGLAFAGSALATPSYVVSVLGSATTLTYAQSESEAPLAHVSFYVPAGATSTLGQQAPGTKLGTVNAHIKANQLGGAVVPVSGDIVADDPAKYATAATACTGSATHQAVWILNLTAAGQTLQVPLFGDAAAGPDTAFAAFNLQVCLPPPQLAQLGAQVLDASLAITGVFIPAAGGPTVWRAVVTPYTPGTTTVNPAGTFEVQSIVAGPVRLTLKASYARATRVITVTGTLTQGGQAVAGLSVRVYFGLTPAQVNLKTPANKPYSLKTGSSGAFTKKAAVRKGFKGNLYFRATAKGAAATTVCVGALPQTSVPAGCINATTASLSATSGLVRIRIA